MSPDPEDTALVSALRDDLPSLDTSARLRRRLLAAGLAIGNGVAATTTAAAAGAAPGAVAGAISKGLALSWGVKLGALAVVAIPSVGLLVESRAEPQLAAPAAVVAVAPAARSSARESASAAGELVATSELPAASEPAVSAPAARAGRVVESQSSPVPAATSLAPSRVAFDSPDATGSKAASTLAEETRILDGAFAELSAGRAAPAAALIAEHQRRFPNGLLQKERERARARLNEMSRGE
jgi:hypothetical protein